ncbi:MAG: hypothetical protein AAB375_02235 [Patescibacteria group bacterium]
MRQPRHHFIHRTGTAVYLDANIASLKACRNGCIRDADHACIHRFGSQVYVIAQQSRISFTRLSDLQVILDFLHIILGRWKGGAIGVWKRRYVILTSDRRFVQSAERSYRMERNMRKLPLRFKSDSVTYEDRGYPWDIRIEVHVLPHDANESPNNLRDAIRYTLSRLSR